MHTATDELEVTINGEPSRVAAGMSVREFLESLDLHPGMVVVERNREILEREAYARTPVEEGDRLELVHFVGGG